jgi:hypothetical protein
LGTNKIFEFAGSPGSFIAAFFDSFDLPVYDWLSLLNELNVIMGEPGVDEATQLFLCFVAALVVSACCSATVF